MPRSSKLSIEQINLLDYGSSATKSLDQTMSGAITVRAYDPQVVDLIPEDLKDPLFVYKPTVPIENQAWVSWGDRIYATGKLAKLKRGDLSLHHLKQERIIPKSLAAIFPSLGDRRKATIAVVGQLPAGEWASRDELSRDLTQALKEFNTPLGVYKVKATVIFMPEGAGIVAYKEMNDPNFYDKSIASFIIGFRNLSALVVEGGVQSIIRSSKWGFSALVQDVSDHVKEQSVERLTPILSRAFNPPYRLESNVLLDRRPFFEITHARSGAKQVQEVDQLVAAAEAALERYLKSAIGWMQGVVNELSGSCDEVILSGGTAETLKRHFSKRWMQQFPLYSFHAELSLPTSLDDKELGVRLLDPYAALMCLSPSIFDAITV
ncbi:hypothetical protein [Leptolyngbya sp. AN10]|uniref:hypothetical protein n=1 Tax=Leptolyngbya sp. AN10 TaxID=3423365 RepID=UPI003D310E9B